MTDERTIEARIYERLSKVIDPELGRSVTDLGMIAAIDAIPVEGKANTYEVRVEVELTVEGCPLSQTITNQINGAVSSYPEATLLPRIGSPFLTTRPRAEDGRNYEGMGLGLFIAKALLEGSGARLEFANAAGRGARITVTWSRAAIAADDRGALGPNPEIHG